MCKPNVSISSQRSLPFLFCIAKYFKYAIIASSLLETERVLVLYVSNQYSSPVLLQVILHRVILSVDYWILDP